MANKVISYPFGADKRTVKTIIENKVKFIQDVGLEKEDKGKSFHAYFVPKGDSLSINDMLKNNHIYFSHLEFQNVYDGYVILNTLYL